MEIKQIKYLSEKTLSYLIEKCKATFALINHKHTASEVGADASGSAASALGLANDYTDEKIATITSGDTVVKESEHSSTADEATHATSADIATKADSATTADSATKAEQDGNGNVIADIYETKSDAQTKYDELKEIKADWNQNDESASDYIKNRTHYDNRTYEEVEVEKNLTFDGVLEGKEYVQYDGDYLVKISDSTYTKDELLGNTITVSYGETTEIIDSHIQDLSSQNIPITVVGEGAVFIAYEDCSFMGMDFTKGTWFIYSDWYVVSSSLTHTVKEITVNGELVQLDEKYIQDTIARTQYVDENFALKSDLQNIDLSSLETKEDAQVKYDEAIEYTNKQIKSHVHSWDDLEDKPFITEQNIDDAFNDIFGGE